MWWLVQRGSDSVVICGVVAGSEKQWRARLDRRSDDPGLVVAAAGAADGRHRWWLRERVQIAVQRAAEEESFRLHRQWLRQRTSSWTVARGWRSGGSLVVRGGAQLPLDSNEEEMRLWSRLAQMGGGGSTPWARST
ncbi:hypothetical protein LR48_Vigan02g258200 [Vigna angularis]|uniref:Uncharacterized protein n=1 Tax=Phaseolus angularis TaxID=3914 RepID=A0A0L9U175_PHAAN|nr:hypothetical protein LR48_Vigan02g258200 [Vigna angularis]